jgi:hypothetical protein
LSQADFRCSRLLAENLSQRTLVLHAHCLPRLLASGEAFSIRRANIRS